MNFEETFRIYVPFPEQFDFYWPESWPSWFKYFERYLSLQNLISISDKKKVELLCYSMGPLSHKILMRIFPDYENGTYETVTQTLNKYFTPHCSICNGLENLKISSENDSEKLDECGKMYRYTIKNLSNIMENQPFHYSPIFCLHNLSWQILIRKRICDQEQKFLSISLWFHNYEKSNVKVVGELRLLSQKLEESNLIVKMNHVFSSTNDFWENTHFMKWEEVLDPQTGFIKDDCITLEIEIMSVTLEN